MYTVSVWLMTLTAVTLFPSYSTESSMSDRLEILNVDEILSNRRLLVPYILCVLEKGKCTPEGTDLKEKLRDALQNGCKICTDKQKKQAKKVIEHIVNHEPDYWKQLSAKYDPTGKFSSTYETTHSEIRNTTTV